MYPGYMSEKNNNQYEMCIRDRDLRDLYRTGVTNTTNVSFSKSVKDFNTRVSFTNSYRTGVQPNSDAILNVYCSCSC